MSVLLVHGLRGREWWIVGLESMGGEGMVRLHGLLAGISDVDALE